MKKTLFLLVLFINLFVAQSVSAQGTIDPLTIPLAAGCTVTVPTPTITDSDGGPITGDQTTYYMAGDYTITWSYTDLGGNPATAEQIVTVINPARPANENCWDDYQFNTASCIWVNNGTQPAPPTDLACYQTLGDFNTTTCSWDVTGEQPAPPTDLACYQTLGDFNTDTCSWDVTGEQPAPPTDLACYQTLGDFNTDTCSWDVTGEQPAPPTDLACYQTLGDFNTDTCEWDVTGEQPAPPTDLACYETLGDFNTDTCSWDVTGEQPAPPTDLACYETLGDFNTDTCSWDVTGEQPAPPTDLACYQTLGDFNTDTCEWDVTGEQPAPPTDLACYQTLGDFNTDTCSWDVTGEQPAPPTDLACYQTLGDFNTDTCEWDVTGEQPAPPTDLACYQTLGDFNTDTCEWDVTGTPVSTPTATAQTFNAGATVANLVAEGDYLSWYAGLTDEVALDPETTLSTGTYYVSQRLEIDGCESERISVSVTVSNDAFTTVSDDLANALVNSGYGDLLVDGKIDNALASQVDVLDLSGQNISDLIGFEVFTNLTSLNIADNNFTSLNFGSSDTGKSASGNAFASLQTLICSGNQLTSLDISGLTSLQTLDCSLNPDLTCITVKDVTAAELNTNWIKDDTASYSVSCSKLSVESTSLNAFKATAYPNPFNNGFVIDVNTLSQELLTIKVYDMIGKLVEQREVSPSKISENRIGQNYSSGIYNIIITQESEVKTLRVIKN